MPITLPTLPGSTPVLIPVPRQKWIEPEDVSKVIQAARTARDKALMAVVYQLGLRRSEVGKILRTDYDGESIEFGRLKGTARIKVKLWDRTKQLLDEYLSTRTDSKDWLFITRIKKAMSGQMVYLTYRSIARSIGLSHVHCHPHTLRHSIASHLARSGMDITEIQVFLGHSSPECTVVYMAGARNRAYDFERASASYHVAHW